MRVDSKWHLWFGAVVSVVVTALVVWPAFIDPDDDSFPLSTYPMFSRGKPNSDLVVTQVLGVFPDGTRKPLPPKLSTGNQEVIQTLSMIAAEAYGGPARARRLCRDAAARVAQSNHPRWSETTSIEIVRSRFDAVAYFEEGPAPRQRRTLRRCEVER